MGKWDGWKGNDRAEDQRTFYLNTSLFSGEAEEGRYAGSG